VTATDPFSRRAITRHLAIGAALVIGIVGIPAVIICVLFFGSSPGGLITDQQFSGARLGQTRSSIEHTVGAPSPDAPVYKIPPPPTGSIYTYYVEADSIMDPLIYQLCYVENRLSSKTRFDAQGPVPDSSAH
jgi:hypothetical protein